MSFFIIVNQEKFSLRAEILLDDLSKELVNRAEIEALAQMLAERFALLSCKTLLVQGLSNTLLLAVLLAAWRVGLKVALMRADAFLPYFDKAIEKLEEHLHIFYDPREEEVFARLGRKQFLFSAWIAEASHQPLLCTPYEWNEEQVALVFFTSGSTGVPKGVCHSLPNLLRSTISFKEHYEITASDYIACFAELHTNTGIRTLCLNLFSLVSVTFIRKLKGTQSHELSVLKDATFMICGPYMIETLLHIQGELESLLHPGLTILSLGSYLPSETVHLMYERYQISVLNFYGLTETFGFALADKIKNMEDCLPPPCQDVFLSLRPVISESNLFHLLIHSPNLFLGYLGEKLQRKTVFDTGDLTSKNKNGQLKFMGRASGAAKSKNGEWIFPLQLETWLRRQPGVQDAIVKVNPPLVQKQLLSIMLKSDAAFSELTYQLMQKIMHLFGYDYHSIDWCQANIKRSVEGKVEHEIYA